MTYQMILNADSAPIRELPDIAQQDKKTGDYSIWIEKQPQDEIGLFGAAYRRLLEHKPLREDELHNAGEQPLTVLDTRYRVPRLMAAALTEMGNEEGSVSPDPVRCGDAGDERSGAG